MKIEYYIFLSTAFCLATNFIGSPITCAHLFVNIESIEGVSFVFGLVRTRRGRDGGWGGKGKRLVATGGELAWRQVPPEKVSGPRAFHLGLPESLQTPLLAILVSPCVTCYFMACLSPRKYHGA